MQLEIGRDSLEQFDFRGMKKKGTEAACRTMVPLTRNESLRREGTQIVTCLGQSQEEVSKDPDHIDSLRERASRDRQRKVPRKTRGVRNVRRTKYKWGGEPWARRWLPYAGGEEKIKNRGTPTAKRINELKARTRVRRGFRRSTQ